MVHKDLNQLISDGDWENLKLNTEYQNLPYEKKIMVAKQTVNLKLEEADSIFRETIRDDLKSAGTIMEKRIKPLRNLIKALNACYAGGLNEDEAKNINLLLGIPYKKPS